MQAPEAFAVSAARCCASPAMMTIARLSNHACVYVKCKVARAARFMMLRPGCCALKPTRPLRCHRLHAAGDGVRTACVESCCAERTGHSASAVPASTRPGHECELAARTQQACRLVATLASSAASSMGPCTPCISSVPNRTICWTREQTTPYTFVMLVSLVMSKASKCAAWQACLHASWLTYSSNSLLCS